LTCLPEVEAMEFGLNGLCFVSIQRWTMVERMTGLRSLVCVNKPKRRRLFCSRSDAGFSRWSSSMMC